jgi:hypothetical protein
MMLKRLRPAPQGRAHRIRKRSNHVTIVLGSINTHKQFNTRWDKDNPIGNRLGIIRGWTQTGMVEMITVINLPKIIKIRKYIHARLSKASVSKVITRENFETCKPLLYYC